jgi:predicted AlkP superfamily phosphohydrolase/phosphomutase
MKTVIIGFDAFDPILFERLLNQGRLPELGAFIESGGYRRLGIANPAQSEVSWTSIATGLDPGGHGLFDFVHRNPSNYSLHVSLLPTQKKLFGIQFARPHSAETIFDHAVKQGYPATTLWWPATFPANLGSPIHTIPGLGTPDILGRMGVGTYYSFDTLLPQEEHKTRVRVLRQENKSLYHGSLEGPTRKKIIGTMQSAVEFGLEVIDGDTLLLRFQKQEHQLIRGTWSPVIHLSFPMGLGVSVHAITRVMFNDHPSGSGVYFLPLQIHPLHSPWPYATPPGFIKDKWKSFGPFLTLGWPQDTTGLEEQFISDDQFLQLCESILQARENIFFHELENYREGILAVVFDSLDRIQHMFWRDRLDIVERWYEKLDALFGRIIDRVENIDQETLRVFVLSDHGFTSFDYKVHLNRWLIDSGFLVPKDPLEEGKFDNVDWKRTQAYAVGLSSVYANLSGREVQGIVPQTEIDSLRARLKEKLLQWNGPDGKNVVSEVWTGEEAFNGPLVRYGPDLVVGFNNGYRASAQTGLGGWEPDSIESNPDHWGADHCIDPALVPGVFLTNVDLGDMEKITYRELPELMIGAKVDEFKPSSDKPPQPVDEDQKILEERLKDLGYL